MADLTVPVPETASVTAAQVIAGCARATGWVAGGPLTALQHVIRHLRRELVLRYRQDRMQAASEAAIAEIGDPE